MSTYPMNSAFVTNRAMMAGSEDFSYADSDINKAIQEGALSRVWEFVNKGYQISLFAGRDSNLRAIIENCPDIAPDIALVQLVLARMNLQQINYLGSKISTALQQAVLCRNVPVVRLLLEAQADVNIPNQNGNTALHHTTMLWNIPKYSLKQCSKKKQIQDLFKRSTESAKLLIDRGASLNVKNKNGLTPLMACITTKSCKRVNITLISLLVSEGADLAGSPWNQTIDKDIIARLGRVNRAVQKGLEIRQQKVKEALDAYIPSPIAALTIEYV